jgi:pyruvate dehydrogenase E2 component (dihydrolipoamide acetyltransferase)
MPSLGADMEQGTLVEWRVRPGDRIVRGDVIALVETEKGLIEVEVFVSGVVESLVVDPGATVPVGTVLAMIRGDAEPPAAEPRGAAAAAAPPAPAPASAPPPAPPPPPPSLPAAQLRVSPLARRLAGELHVDLATVRGTGEGGAITKADVERAAAERPIAPAAGTAAAGAADRLASMRKVIATAMARSKREIPHYYLGTQIDMGPAVAWLAAENARRPVSARLLHAVLLLRAVALAAREVPEMNGFWRDGRFQPGDGVHVGVAISLRQGGLVAPAIHDVDRKSLDQLMPELLDLVKRTRAGVLRSSEVSDATITVTNLGDQGVETVFGVIYPPQVALVGFGRLVERPWVSADGGVATRPLITASLSADHRASDGHRGGRFLAAIEQWLQKPEAL